MLDKPGKKDYFVAAIGGIATFCMAITYTWSSPLLSSFRNPKSSMYLTSIEIAFLTSVCDLSHAIACVPAAYLADIVGRKYLLRVTAPVCGISWILLLIYRNKAVLFSVRFIQGMSTGLMMGIQNSVMSVYLAEIANNNTRGNAISYWNIAWHLGTLYIYIVGRFFGFEGLTWFTLLPHIAVAVLFFWSPESPYYLVTNEKRDKAVKGLVWLRGGTPEDSHIIEEIQMIDETIKLDESTSKGAWTNLFCTKTGRKGLLIVELVTIVYAMGGTNTIPVYASDTIAQLSGNVNLADDITIILGVLLVVCVIPPIVLVDKWGRRPLLLLSMAGSAIFFIPTSILLYLIQKENVTALSVKTACYVLLVVAMSFATLGVETIQPILLSEFFPSTSRSISAGGTLFFITLLQSMSCYLYEYINDQVGIYLNYVVFLIVTVVGLIGVYILMPETKCKTFAEIQSILSSNNNHQV